MADMPFMSYSTDELALENATKLMQNGAHSVKIEGGSWICKMTSTLAERGIPVCAHMGLTPQSINRIGGYFVQGRDTKKRQKRQVQTINHPIYKQLNRESLSEYLNVQSHIYKSPNI